MDNDKYEIYSEYFYKIIKIYNSKLSLWVIIHKINFLLF